jgi:hypothetical protein
VPSTKASSVETKVIEAALKSAGTATADDCADVGDALPVALAVEPGDAETLGLGLTGGGVLEAELPEPHAPTTVTSARHAATTVRVRTWLDISTSLSHPGGG